MVATLEEYFHSSLDASLDLLRKLVGLESHSLDKAGVDALCRFLAGEFEARGAEVRVLRQSERGDIFKAVWRRAGVGLPVMMLGHLDTVWPRGTSAGRPFRIEEGRAFGPGVFDMKGGLLLCLLVCQAFQDKKINPGKDVLFFFTADEEIGTGSGLPHLKSEAAACRAVLCLEPPLPGGKAKTFRKGVGEFRLRVKGVAAHAGVDHEKGANAILELSRLVVQMQSLTDYQNGITLNVGRVRGGSATNVVPDFADAEVDFRVPTLAAARRLEEQVRSLQPADPRCNLQIDGGLSRPPLERTPAVAGLYEKARLLALGMGMELGEGSTGGGSDGSFTAAMGIPTLDGLGVEGEGAHAVHEHIVIDDIPRRAALLARLVASL